MEKGITQTAKHTLLLGRLCWKRERAKLRCWEKICTSSS